MKNKVLGRNKIKISIRKKVFGSLNRPRLTVFRSNKNIYAQIIADEKNKTIVSASNKEIKKDTNITKVEQARQVGLILGQKAKSAGIKKIVFDRNGYLYHGRVKNLAEGAREAGMIF